MQNQQTEKTNCEYVYVHRLIFTHTHTYSRCLYNNFSRVWEIRLEMRVSFTAVREQYGKHDVT